MRTSSGSRSDARNRRIIAEKYLEVAEVAAIEEGHAANNVIVGIAVLAGIAASDAICLAALGKRYAGDDHGEAARLLTQVDQALGGEFQKLIRLKPGARYGSTFINPDDRRRALRVASKLVETARARTIGA